MSDFDEDIARIIEMLREAGCTALVRKTGKLIIRDKATGAEISMKEFARRLAG